MADQTPHIRPLSPSQAPDPATVYERAKPEKEGGMGRLDNNKFAPEKSRDKMEDAVSHKQANRQLNAHDVVDERDAQPADGSSLSRDDEPKQTEHS